MREITGRDNYIVAKALCYAIEAINRLPESHQDAIDRDDMAKLLSAMVDDEGMMREMKADVLVHLGVSRHPSR